MSSLARTPQQIGAVIARARRQRNWTQHDLADRSSLRQGTISSIENGERPARLDTILAVLAALDLELTIAPRSKGASVSPEDLF